MKAWWPLILLAAPLLAGAQTDNTDLPDDDTGSKGIYRTVDANGNVVFTDNPPDKNRAEEVKVGPTNTMDSPPKERRADSRGDAPPEPPPLPEDTGYESVSITAPEAGANLRIPQDNPIQIQVSLSPSLKGGHRLVILDNGTPLEGTVMNFPNPGQHTLVAQVRAGGGEVLIESRPLVFYVMRTTASTGNGGGEEGDKEGGQGSAFPSFGSRAERGGAADTGGRAERGAGASRGGAASVGGAASRVTAPAAD